MMVLMTVGHSKNNPLLLQNYTSAPDLSFHYIIHTVLDVIEERGMTPSPPHFHPQGSSSGNSTDAYLGLLYALEDTAVYGYVTSSKIKFIVALGMTEIAIRESELRNVVSEREGVDVGIL